MIHGQVPRTLHLSRFAAPAVGGTERYISDLVGYLESQGAHCLIGSTNRTDGSHHGHHFRLRAVGPAWAKIIVGRKRLRRAVSGVEVVHLHDLRLSPLKILRTARSLGKPVVVSTHGLVFHTSRRRALKTIVWRLYFLPTLRRFHAILADSPADLETCLARGLRNRVVLFENPVSVPRFVSRVGTEPTVVRSFVQLLYFGRLDTNKNVEWVIDLCRSRVEFHLDIVGRGDVGYVELLRARAGEALDSRVRFLGELADSEIDTVLKQSDCLVFPSSYEGFGITLVEGMATGIPVVASDIESYRSIVGDAGVPLVALGDMDGLEFAIRSVLSSWNSVPVVERALEYSWDNRGDFLLGLYRRLACLN